MKKYSKVVRHGKKGTHLTLEDGPHITVMEKLDGANASFTVEDGELKCFSRKNELNEENNLRGFYQWVHENINPEDLVKGGIYFGEWLVKHSINYPEDVYQNFYLFDIYDTDVEQYINFRLVKKEAERLNINLVPVFYEGKFQSLEHINSFVGESKLGDVGEGVIVKNYNYRDRYGDQVFTKIVSDQFAEKAKVKKQKQPQNNNDELDNFVDTYLTKARVEKMLNKLVDEGVIDEDYDVTDTGTILKNSASRIADDVIEEELDSLIKVVKKKIGKKYPEKVKSVVNQ